MVYSEDNDHHDSGSRSRSRVSITVNTVPIEELREAPRSHEYGEIPAPFTPRQYWDSQDGSGPGMNRLAHRLGDSSPGSPRSPRSSHGSNRSRRSSTAGSQRSFIQEPSSPLQTLQTGSLSQRHSPSGSLSHHRTSSLDVPSGRISPATPGRPNFRAADRYPQLPEGARQDAAALGDEYYYTLPPTSRRDSSGRPVSRRGSSHGSRSSGEATATTLLARASNQVHGVIGQLDTYESLSAYALINQGAAMKGLDLEMEYIRLGGTLTRAGDDSELDDKVRQDLERITEIATKQTLELRGSDPGVLTAEHIKAAKHIWDDFKQTVDKYSGAEPESSDSQANPPDSYQDPNPDSGKCRSSSHTQRRPPSGSTSRRPPWGEEDGSETATYAYIEKF